LGMRVNFRGLETLESQVRFEGRIFHLTTIPVASGYQCTLAGETPLTINLSHFFWSAPTQLDEVTTLFNAQGM